MFIETICQDKYWRWLIENISRFSGKLLTDPELSVDQACFWILRKTQLNIKSKSDLVNALSADELNTLACQYKVVHSDIEGTKHSNYIAASIVWLNYLFNRVLTDNVMEASEGDPVTFNNHLCMVIIDFDNKYFPNSVAYDDNEQSKGFEL